MAFALSERDHRRLQGVHPDLVKVVEAASQQQDVPHFVVIEGLRTLEQQKKYLAQGASWTLKSRHLTGHAVDIAPSVAQDKSGRWIPTWHWPHYHQLAPIIKRVASELAVPITWGGDWQAGKKDGPHWELTWKSYPA